MGAGVTAAASFDFDSLAAKGLQVVTAAATGSSAMRQLWARVAFTSGARVYVILTGLVGLVITARVIGPAGRGSVASVVTWVTLFVTFGHLSLGQVAIHEASVARDDSWLEAAFGTLAVTCIAVSGLCIAAALAVGLWSNAYGTIAPTWLLIGFAALPFQLWELYGSSLLMGLDRIEIYNRFQVIGRTGGLLLLVVLLALHTGVAGALWAITVGQVVIAGGGTAYLWRRCGRRLVFDRVMFRRLLAGGLRLHLNAVGFFLTTSVNVLLLNYYRGLSETGLYQFATQLTFAMLVVPQAASSVLYGAVAKRGVVASWQQMRAVLFTMTALMTVGATIVTMAAPLLMRVLAGPAFAGAVAPFRVLVWSLVGMTISTVMGPQWIGRGLFGLSSVVALAGGVANAAVTLYLLRSHGMMAPAWASTLIYSAIGLFSVALAVRCEREWRGQSGEARQE